MTIFASIPISEYLEVERIITEWEAQGLGAEVFDSGEYAALNDGYWVLGFGGLRSRTEAEEVCAEVLGSRALAFMPDCQVRQI